MSDMMHEIDDELRQEKLSLFWKENAGWIIGGIILAIVMTGALTYWRNYQAGKDIAATQQLLTAVNEENQLALEAMATMGGDMHSAFAGLIAAGRYAREGDVEKAVTLYDQVAATRGADQLYRDLATLLSTGHKLDREDPAVLHKALEPLTKKSIWRFSALEMQALLYAREGRMKEAVKSLTEITVNAQAPADLRQRAQTFRELYLGADGVAAETSK